MRLLMLPRWLLLPLLYLLTHLCVSGNPAQEIITWEAAAQSFTRYCKECHGKTTPDTDLDLVTIDHRTDLAADPEKWETILKALRTHYMPHPDGREMPLDKREPLINKVRHELVLLSAHYDSESSAFRRLNRVEFSNTLNDLFFVDEERGQSLPADDAGYGFDNIASVLSISPLLLERYFDVAARVAMLAVPQRVSPFEWSLSAMSFNGGRNSDTFKYITTEGSRASTHLPIFFPARGSYSLTLKLSAEQAGPDNAAAELWIDGNRVDSYEVIAAKGQLPNEVNQLIQINKAGENRVEVRLKKDYYVNTETEKEDRNLIFHGLSIEGPHQGAEDLTSPFLDRHFGSLPESLSRQALRDGIHRFASRAYRRPITSEEADSLWDVYRDNSKGIDGVRRNGIYAVIDAVLTSPAFLFRVEARAGIEDAQEFALASWLSYFLWSSMSDDRLFNLALRGELQANLESEIQRMLIDPRSAALAENFAGQWWRTRDLDFHKPDTAVYEGVNKAPLSSMREETRRSCPRQCHFSNGCTGKKTGGEDIHLGRSFDQVAADHLSAGSRFRSLELSATNNRSSGVCDSGYSCAYQYNISWQNERTPVPPQINPREVFKQLFGATDPREVALMEHRMSRQKSVLDSLRRDTARINRKISTEDRDQLEEYYTSLRAVEQRLQTSHFDANDIPKDFKLPDGIPASYSEYLDTMYDLMLLAFRTDSTRVITFLQAHDGSGRVFPEHGINSGHHHLSHHKGEAQKIEHLKAIDEFYLQAFARFLEKLAHTQDGAGRTLADSCMLVYGGAIGDGNRHNHDNLPVILAGGAFEAIDTSTSKTSQCATYTDL